MSNGHNKGRTSDKTVLGIVIGAVVLVVVLVVTTTFLMPALLGGAVLMAGAPIGALADQNAKQQSSVCTVGGAIGTGNYGTLSTDQNANVRVIVGVAKGLKMDENAQIIAVMTALQETDLGADPTATRPNSDGDAGLFQQRQLPGWYGSLEMVNDPAYAAQAFFLGVTAKGSGDWGSVGGGGHIPGLVDVKGWQGMEKGRAAQQVQKSAFPSYYSKHEQRATQLVRANADAPAIAPGQAAPAAPAAPPAAGAAAPAPAASGSKFTRPIEAKWPLTSGFGPRNSPGGIGSTNHKGQDFGAPLGAPIFAALDGEVAAAGDKSGFGQWVVINHTIDGKLFSTVYGHMPPSSITVKVGDQVKAGQQIATVGKEGKSTGAHLHFEVWPGGRLTGQGHAVNPKGYLDGSANPSADAAGVSAGGASGCGVMGAGSGIPPLNATGSAATAIKAATDAAAQNIPYSWGGGGLNGPSTGIGPGRSITGYDCSGLMRYAIFQATGQQLPRTAKQQYAATAGNVVARKGDGLDKLQPGDLMFWGNSAGSIHHMGMYMGNGMIVEASNSRNVIRVSSAEGRLGGDYFGATRIAWTADASAAGKAA